ncbi:Gfo/Idh/MocA family protein [Kribbella sp. CA-245084]|uniref:Gfo/Idh/MocA family protein n=1 Tax=Kribbella sp. CA-245084 TaxID=3239940 RepID=UPI003D89EAFF
MTVGVALVGAGSWTTRFHAPAVDAHPGAQLVAVCDPDLAAAGALARRRGARVVADIGTLVADGNFDCAIVATPHATHRPIAEAILRSGRHVLVEKPLATNTDDAFALVQLAAEQDLHLSVGFTSQHSPSVAVVRHWVRTQIGPLAQVSIEFSSRAGALFTAARYDASATYSASNGGGQGHTQLSHAIAMLASITGEQADSVAAFVDSRGLEVDLLDAVAFRLEGGAIGVASSTGTLSSQLAVTQRLRYIGERGIVDQDILFGTAHLQREDGSHVTTGRDHLQPPYPAEAPARAFLELVLGNGPNVSPPEPAAAAVAFVEAMHRSAVSGARVRVRRLPAATA